MKFSVIAGSEKLRSAKLKLPRQLRFAAGKAFAHGTAFAPKPKVRHTKGRLTIKARKPAERLRGKLTHGALLPAHGHRPRKRMKFKFKIRDTAGETTKLVVRTR
jgi:hypothetical protein